ncbi:hypothetical protein CHLNCDRAFT_52833 [Chlorella variabilis]|uniref:Nucleotide-diphospho-sugar transferase domain-containing protein n=1 Tax=Chlorella variabilis TaxID=554065 RepID=E1ZH47_CHLVA|nr:hypothetical protein CHLNCDRAFT_52833 [Chlorella variabilis]EFN55055.1 hypothetical protein CHLNCDRAFT_52833 [Chlorella variabilis]|eukprot:XP_005847157.1 hypothetical protein CHLNCDRAFT_52833 [Chlorella variabilis]
MLLSTLVIMSAMVLLLVALKPGRLATMGPSAAIIGLRRPRCQGRGPGQAISQPHNRPGRLPPGTMPMEHPSRATFNRVQADPSLPERDASIVAEFEAAPWLLPPRTKALTYTGVHNLGQLLELRATPFGKHPKTMTLLTLNKQFAVMTQNTIYSMVKFGGVRNYIVATWDPGDLAACADLNLPCADVTRFLPEPMNRAQDAGAFGSHDYLVVCWLRSFLLTHLLRQGFVVFSTDSDISYFLKPVWESYMRFMEEAGADAAFQTEAPRAAPLLAAPVGPAWCRMRVL